MPWDIILAAVGSSSLTAIIIVVLGVTLAQKFMEQRVANATRHFESSLRTELTNDLVSRRAGPSDI